MQVDAAAAYQQGYLEALRDSDPIKRATVLAIIEECALQAVCAAPNDGRDHAECPFCSIARDIRALKERAPKGAPPPAPNAGIQPDIDIAAKIITDLYEPTAAEVRSMAAALIVASSRPQRTGTADSASLIA